MTGARLPIRIFGAALLAMVAAGLPGLRAQTAPPSLLGVYQVIPGSMTLPGGLRNTGSPRDIGLRPAAIEKLKSVDLKEDALKVCLPLGAFRMMAAEGTKIEIVPTPDNIVMLFEDLSHGFLRTFYLKRPHRTLPEATWMGDSTAKWEGNTLVVDTVGINERVWLNERGVQHSPALHLVERITPVLGGKYLEYTMTADDPPVLVAPYTYKRYYQKLDTEIMDDTCEIQD